MRDGYDTVVFQVQEVFRSLVVGLELFGQGQPDSPLTKW